MYMLFFPITYVQYAYIIPEGNMVAPWEPE